MNLPLKTWIWLNLYVYVSSFYIESSSSNRHIVMSCYSCTTEKTNQNFKFSTLFEHLNRISCIYFVLFCFFCFLFLFLFLFLFFFHWLYMITDRNIAFLIPLSRCTRWALETVCKFIVWFKYRHPWINVFYFYSLCVFSTKLWNDGVNLAVVSILKSHRHKLYIIKHCTNIV